MRYMSSVILSFYVARTFPGCCLRVLRLGLEIKCKSTTLTHDTDTLKQQLILIIKLVTSVFWFPCFNRKINQRVLFVFFRILYCKICVQFFNKPIHNFKPIKFATSNNVLHFYRVLGKNQTQRWRHSPYSHSRVLRFLIGK